ncbi:MAG TPA: metallophosphoesterase [Gemmatimonadales bacterium]
MRLRLAAVAAVLWVAGLMACMGGPRPVTAPVTVPAPESITHSIILIGDAGAPAPGDPVLAALERAAARAPSRTSVVFLGDNVYPAGLPEAGSADRVESERRLLQQLDAVARAGAAGYLIAGNHDWFKNAPGGWEAIRRQEAFIQERGGGRLVLLPGGGCPGPEVRDAGPIRLVLLNTPWWFNAGDRPEAGSTCLADTPDELEGSLRNILAANAGRPVVLVGHHPIASASEHGGHFNLRQHLFPLTELAPWAWLPLPVVGSLYPAYRSLGFASQDLSSGIYTSYREMIGRAMRDHPPLLVAAGHEHTLQVMEGIPWLVVSGTGYFGHASPAGWFENTRYASSAAGWVQLDALADGRIRMAVIEIAKDGTMREAFSTYLHGRERDGAG